MTTPLEDAEAFALELLSAVVGSFGPAEIEGVLAMVLGQGEASQLLEPVASLLTGVIASILNVLDPQRVRDELARRYDADDLEIARELRAKFAPPATS